VQRVIKEEQWSGDEMQSKTERKQFKDKIKSVHRQPLRLVRTLCMKKKVINNISCFEVVNALEHVAV